MVPVALDTISWQLQPVLWIRSWFRLGSSILGQCGSGSCSLFYFLWVIFALLDQGSDPADQNKCGPRILNMTSGQNLLSAELLFQLRLVSSQGSLQAPVLATYGSLHAKVRFLAIATLRHHWKTAAPIFRPHRIESSLAWISHSLQ